MADHAPALREQQFALAQHLRDPRAAPAPAGIDERRLRVYRDLLYNNIQSLLAGNFPVIRKTLGDDRWQALVRDFHARHRARTPLFPEIGREFIAFVERRASEDADDPPWLPELAHYEWVELALQISDAAVPPHKPADEGGRTPPQDLLDGIPVVSPQAWPLAYRWPVHRIGPDHQPTAPPDAPTLLLVRRDAGGDVRFAQLSPLAFRLLELLAANMQHSGRELLQALADEAGVADIETFVTEGAALLATMHADGTIPGVRAVE
jgi:uncharacterized protein